MTFEKWWQENKKDVNHDCRNNDYTGIRILFKYAWHDGYMLGRSYAQYIEKPQQNKK